MTASALAARIGGIKLRIDVGAGERRLSRGRRQNEKRTSKRKRWSASMYP